MPPSEPNFEDLDGQPPSIDEPRSREGPTGARVQRGIGWGGLLVSAMAELAGLAASLSFAQFVSSALARDDWIRWTALALLGVAGVAAFVILMREADRALPAAPPDAAAQGRGDGHRRAGPCARAGEPCGSSGHFFGGVAT